VLVPLPGSADGHQRANAEVAARDGAAELLLQQELTGETLVERVLALVRDEARRQRMAAAARSLARPDAASLVVDRVEQLARW